MLDARAARLDEASRNAIWNMESQVEGRVDTWMMRAQFRALLVKRKRGAAHASVRCSVHPARRKRARRADGFHRNRNLRIGARIEIRFDS
jgi:hypothetical protein